MNCENSRRKEEREIKNKRRGKRWSIERERDREREKRCFGIFRMKRIEIERKEGNDDDKGEFFFW